RTHRRITGREPEAGRSDDSATRAAEEGSVCSSRRTPRSGRSAASPCTPVYRPHSTLIAGIVVLAAGLYEHTPPRQATHPRALPRAPRLPLVFGRSCVASVSG